MQTKTFLLWEVVSGDNGAGSWTKAKRFIWLWNMQKEKKDLENQRSESWWKMPCWDIDGWGKEQWRAHKIYRGWNWGVTCHHFALLGSHTPSNLVLAETHRPKFWVLILLNHAWSEMVWHNFLNTKVSYLKHISLLYTFSLKWNRIPVLINSQKLSFPSLKSLNLSFLGPRFVFILGLGFHDNRCITMHFCILLVFSQFTRTETNEQI